MRETIVCVLHTSATRKASEYVIIWTGAMRVIQCYHICPCIPAFAPILAKNQLQSRLVSPIRFCCLFPSIQSTDSFIRFKYSSIKPHCGSMTFSIGIANTFVYKYDKKQSFVTYRKKSWKKTIIRRLLRRFERLGAPFHSLWNYGSCNVSVTFKHLKSKEEESIRIRLRKEGLINSLCATTSNTPMRNHD